MNLENGMRSCHRNLSFEIYSMKHCEGVEGHGQNKNDQNIWKIKGNYNLIYETNGQECFWRHTDHACINSRVSGQ